MSLIKASHGRLGLALEMEVYGDGYGGVGTLFEDLPASLVHELLVLLLHQGDCPFGHPFHLALPSPNYTEQG
jgi:hypothetical protein